MKLKYLIIACVIITIIAVGVVFFVSKGNDNVEAIPIEGTTYEESEKVNVVTFRNKTGKEIEEMFIYDSSEFESDEFTCENVLDEKLPDGEETSIAIPEVREGSTWCVEVKTTDGSYELNKLLDSVDLIDGTALEMYMNEESLHIDIVLEIDDEESNV